MLPSISANLNKNLSKSSKEPESSKGIHELQRNREDQPLPISSSSISNARTSTFSNDSSAIPSSSNLNIPRIPTLLPGNNLIK